MLLKFYFFCCSFRLFAAFRPLNMSFFCCIFKHLRLFGFSRLFLTYRYLTSFELFCLSRKIFIQCNFSLFAGGLAFPAYPCPQPFANTGVGRGSRCLSSRQGGYCTRGGWRLVVPRFVKVALGFCRVVCPARKPRVNSASAGHRSALRVIRRVRVLFVQHFIKLKKLYMRSKLTCAGLSSVLDSGSRAAGRCPTDKL